MIITARQYTLLNVRCASYCISCSCWWCCS